MFTVFHELEKKKKQLKSTVTWWWLPSQGCDLRAQSCYWLEPQARGSQQLWIRQPSINEMFDQHLNIFKLLFFLLVLVAEPKTSHMLFLPSQPQAQPLTAHFTTMLQLCLSHKMPRWLALVAQGGAGYVCNICERKYDIKLCQIQNVHLLGSEETLLVSTVGLYHSSLQASPSSCLAMKAGPGRRTMHPFHTLAAQALPSQSPLCELTGLRTAFVFQSLQL